MGQGTMGEVAVLHKDLQGYASIQDVNRAFQQLSGNQEKFGKLLNENLEAIHHAFEMVDAHQMVTRRILNDLAKNQVCRDLDGDVDYQWYWQQLGAAQAVIMAFVALAKLQTTEETPSIEASASEDFVIGGDYANSVSTPG